MSRAVKPVPLCVLTVGHQSYILPFLAGTKVAELMQQAIACRKEYSQDYSSNKYVLGQSAEVELANVRSADVVAPSGEPVTKGPLQLGLAKQVVA